MCSADCIGRKMKDHQKGKRFERRLPILSAGREHLRATVASAWIGRGVRRGEEGGANGRAHAHAQRTTCCERPVRFRARASSSTSHRWHDSRCPRLRWFVRHLDNARWVCGVGRWTVGLHPAAGGGFGKGTNAVEKGGAGSSVLERAYHSASGSVLRLSLCGAFDSAFGGEKKKEKGGAHPREHTQAAKASAAHAHYSQVGTAQPKNSAVERWAFCSRMTSEAFGRECGCR